MTTGAERVIIHGAKILGLEALTTQFTDRVDAEILTLSEDLWGSGGVLNGLPTWSVVSDRLSLTSGSVEGVNGAGRRLTTGDTAADGFADVPFVAGGGFYYLAARYCSHPGGVDLGTDGVPRYSHDVDAIGEVIQPVSVSVGASSITLTLTGNIAAEMRWSSNSYTRPARVWLNAGPASLTTQAIYLGEIERSGAGVFTITIPHLLGQASGSASSTASDYRIQIVGLTVGGAALLADLDVLFLGAESLGTVVTSSVVELASFAALSAAFAAEHDPATGEHTDINATTITVEDIDAETIAVQYTTLTGAIKTTPATTSQNFYPGVLVEDSNGSDAIELIPGRPAFNNEGGMIKFPTVNRSANDTATIDAYHPTADSTLRITNSAGSYQARLQIDGAIRQDPTSIDDFAIEANTAGVPTLYVRNVGAGTLDLDVDGQLYVDYAGIGQVEANLVTNSGLWEFTPTAVELSVPVTVEGVPLSVDVAHGFNYCNSFGAAAVTEFTHVCSPHMGGWSVVGASGTWESDTTAAPPHVYMTTVGVAARYAYPISSALYDRNDDNAGTFVSMVGIAFEYVENSGGNVTLYLYSVPNDSTATSRTLERTWSASFGGASWSTYTNSFTEALDPDRTYWIEAYIYDAGSFLDARLANVRVSYTKERIE